jgi:hypothetical protein
MPRDEVLRPLPLDPPKPHERGHLVRVEPHPLIHPLQLAHVVVHRDLEQLPLAVNDSPKDAIQDPPPRRITKTSHALRDLYKLLQDASYFAAPARIASFSRNDMPRS